MSTVAMVISPGKVVNLGEDAIDRTAPSWSPWGPQTPQAESPSKQFNSQSKAGG